MPVLSGTSGASPIDTRRLTDMKNSIGALAALDIISDFRRVLEARLHEFKTYNKAPASTRFHILHDLSSAAETLGLLELALASDRLAYQIRYDPPSADDPRLSEDVVAAGNRAIHAIEEYLRHAAH